MHTLHDGCEYYVGHSGRRDRGGPGHQQGQQRILQQQRRDALWEIPSVLRDRTAQCSTIRKISGAYYYYGVDQKNMVVFPSCLEMRGNPKYVNQYASFITCLIFIIEETK